MSITDELREFVDGADGYELWCPRHKKELLAIADRIDAEHDKALNSVDGAYDSGYNVGYEKGFASADNWLTQNEDAMAEHGWVRLPKDADGEYIHIGDVMAYADNTKPMVVVALVPPAVFLVEDGPRYADMCRHYHAPTVEDVLTEMLAKAIERGELTNGAAQTIAEYASKLQLREDA